MALSTTLVIVSPVFSALSRIFASISWLNRNVTGLLSRLLLCMRCMYSACADVRNNYFGNVFTQLYNGRVSTDVKKLKKPITLRFGPELLARLDEFVPDRCPDCRGLWIRDTLDLLPDNCPACRTAPPAG